MSDVPSNLIPTRVTQLPEAPVASEDSLMMIIYQGNNYKIRVGDLLSVAGVPTSRQVIAGTGLTGGGQLSSNVTLSVADGGIGTVQLAASGVTPGSYGDATTIPVFTVDETGRVVAASSIAVAVSGYVPETREVIAGTGLTGGGQLTGNITLDANLSDATPQFGFQEGSAGTSDEISRADHKHPAVDLGVDVQVDGILGLNNGGTARSLVPDAGAIIWCGADGLYVGPAGQPGQVLVSGGDGEYTWGSALIVAPQQANRFFAGPTSGGAADPNFRAMVNADLPNSGVAASTYGSTTQVPIITVNEKGILTSVSTATVASAPVSSVNGQTGVVVLDYADVGAQQASAQLTTIAGLSPNDGAFIVGNGSAFTTESDATARASLGAAASGSNSDITSLNSISGGISSPDFIQFDATATVTDATAKLYYDKNDQFTTLAFQMNGSVVQKIGEEQYFRVKCSSAVTKGQVVMFTGTLGASGGLTAAPATGLTADQANYILGIADESGATNSWIFVKSFGEVKGINTTGGAESWAQGDVLYYNPSVTGGLTKTKPTTPNAIAVMAAVINVSSSAGILFVRPTFGSVLGGTDGNVQFGTLSNGDVIVYNSSNQRWQNAAQSTLSVGSATTATTATSATTATTATTATNLAGGIASQIPYQTGAGATSFIANGTAGQVLVSAGTSAPAWGGINGGTF